jgi:hypothetical protein
MEVHLADLNREVPSSSSRKSASSETRNSKGVTYIHCLGKFATLQKATTGFIMSVCLHGTTQVPLDGFS